MAGAATNAGDLIKAIRVGDLPTVTILLDADPALADVKIPGGVPPLFHAAEIGSQDLCELLLNRGAKAKTKAGRCSAVHYAARSGNAALARLLRDRGAPVELKAKNDWTDLHDQLWVGRPATALLLIELGMNATLAGKSHGRTNTPLHLAIRQEHMDHSRQRGLRRRIVEALLDRGADPNQLNSQGEAPLHVACTEGHADIVALLLDRGGMLELLDSSGATPLFFAVNGANLATVRLLLDRGAKLKARLPSSAGELAGATPLDMAERFGHRFIERLLRERGAGRQYAGSNAYTNLSRAEIHSAAAHGDVEDLRWILDIDPAEIHALRPMGFVSVQPIITAATFGHEAAVKLLIERGALVNDPANTGSYTPLHSAATQGHAAVVKLLVDAGAKLDHDAGDSPALSEAVYCGYPEVVKVLLDAGADPNILNVRGQTPLAVTSNASPMADPDQVKACAILLREHGGHE